jgi:hypothetical protein
MRVCNPDRSLVPLRDNFSELATARADGLSLSRSNENEGRCLRVHRAFCPCLRLLANCSVLEHFCLRRAISRCSRHFRALHRRDGFLGISLGTRRRLDPFRCAEEQGRVEAVAYVCASASSVSSPRAFLCSNECDLEVNDEGLAFHPHARRNASHCRECASTIRSFEFEELDDMEK